MKLSEIIKHLNLKRKTGSSDTEVLGGYASDLLSDVMANCAEKYLWITLQIHPNIVAVASVKEVAGIILVNGREPEEETLKRAESENVTILSTTLPAFKIAGELYQLGIKAG